MAQKINVSRADYKIFYPITTRWMDNDAYGHVNNVTYYSYFDTAANSFLVKHCGLDYHISIGVASNLHPLVERIHVIVLPSVLLLVP